MLTPWNRRGGRAIKPLEGADGVVILDGPPRLRFLRWLRSFFLDAQPFSYPRRGLSSVGAHPLQKRREQRPIHLIRKRRALMPGMKQIDHSGVQRQVDRRLNLQRQDHREPRKLPPHPLQRRVVQTSHNTHTHGTNILLENHVHPVVV